MKILIINIHSSHNAGDAALTDVTISLLKSRFPHSGITLSMDDPDSHLGEEETLPSLISWVKTGIQWKMGSLLWLLPGTMFPVATNRLWGKPIYLITPKSWRILLQRYIQSDIIISKPGGFLYSSGRGISFFLSIYTIMLAVIADKPIYMLPQSIGPLSHKWECILLNMTLKRLRFISVREPISLLQLHHCGLPPEKCYEFPDVAFAFRGADVNLAKVWVSKHGLDTTHPLMGMTVINWQAQNPDFKSQEKYEVACAGVARYFVEHYGGTVVLFPQVWGPLEAQDDRIPACRIVDRLSDLQERVIVVKSPLPPDMLKSVYSLLDVFIGSRMHSSIFALTSKVPVIAIGYQPKTQGIIQMLELDRWFINIKDVTSDKLITMLVDIWAMKKEIRKQLEEKIPDLIQKINTIGDMIIADYEGING